MLRDENIYIKNQLEMGHKKQTSINKRPNFI
jgi:hypothetical protein